MTGFVGISWSLTVWAPFALIGAEISRRDTLRRRRQQHHRRHVATATATTEDSIFSGDSTPVIPPLDDENSHPDPTNPTQSPASKDRPTEEEKVDQAGVILGLHNVAISSPQILATLLSSAIFRAMQRDRGTPGDDSVGWVLRACGIAVIGAAWMTARLKEGADDEGT